MLAVTLDNETFQILLENLSPHTLAQIIVDLEQAQEDWAHYPEDAPPQETQKALLKLLPVIHNMGQGQAKQGGIDFAQLLEQTKAEREDNGWTTTRDEQEIENWLSDFD